MKRYTTQLKAIAKSLYSLARKVDGLAEDIAGVASTSRRRGRRTVAAPAAAPAEGGPAPAGGDSLPTVLETVYDVVRRSRNGASIAILRQKTGLGARQLSNALYKLSKRGRIEAKARGVYVRKKG
jgi:hypothetical protein